MGKLVHVIIGNASDKVGYQEARWEQCQCWHRETGRNEDEFLPTSVPYTPHDAVLRPPRIPAVRIPDHVAWGEQDEGRTDHVPE